MTELLHHQFGINGDRFIFAKTVHTVVVSVVGETSFASLEVGRRKSITKAQIMSHVGILYHVAGVVMSVKHAP